ncbi:MAG TPA: LysR substrate-binding domain-containing protein [Solirubrobacteraceae bacterium]|jgi:DNA-binding transcriptional LysR family regulator|nr:LysR substrate-binding domain-containing protein [Solirubrobacteraceae bacterium]
MLNPRRLAVLRELARHGSFTGAAQALSYTQSAISQQISALERETGAVLVERDRKRARLTQAGELLLDHAEAILGRIAHAERELSAYVHARAGRLRLAAFESAGAALVPSAVETFHERHPNVELNVVQMEPAEASAHLEGRELDLAIVYDLEPATGALGEELELTYLFDDRYTAVISKGHRLARAGAFGLDALAEDVWINTTPRDLCHEVILGACRAAGFDPKVAFEVDEIATSQALVAHGVGVTLLPDLALGGRHRDVLTAELGAAAPVRSVYAARLATRYPTPACEAMLEVLREVVPEAGRRAPGG